MRQVALVRELTKLHEEVVRGVAPHVAAELAACGEVRGECVVIIGAPEADEATSVPVRPLEDAIAAGLAADEPPSALAKRLAREYGLPKPQVYDRVVKASRAR